MAVRQPDIFLWNDFLRCIVARGGAVRATDALRSAPLRVADLARGGRHWREGHGLAGVDLCARAVGGLALAEGPTVSGAVGGDRLWAERRVCDGLPRDDVVMADGGCPFQSVARFSADRILAGQPVGLAAGAGHLAPGSAGGGGGLGQLRVGHLCRHVRGGFAGNPLSGVAPGPGRRPAGWLAGRIFTSVRGHGSADGAEQLRRTVSHLDGSFAHVGTRGGVHCGWGPGVPPVAC